MAETIIDKEYICKNIDGVKTPISPIAHTTTLWDEERKQFLDVTLKNIATGSGLPTTDRLDVETIGEYALDAHAGKVLYDTCEEVFQSADSCKKDLSKTIGTSEDLSLREIGNEVKSQVKDCREQLVGMGVSMPDPSTIYDITEGLKSVTAERTLNFYLYLSYNDIVGSAKNYGAPGGYMVWLDEESFFKRFNKGIDNPIAIQEIKNAINKRQCFSVCTDLYSYDSHTDKRNMWIKEYINKKHYAGKFEFLKDTCIGITYTEINNATSDAAAYKESYSLTYSKYKINNFYSNRTLIDNTPIGIGYDVYLNQDKDPTTYCRIKIGSTIFEKLWKRDGYGSDKTMRDKLCIRLSCQIRY